MDTIYQVKKNTEDIENLSKKGVFIDVEDNEDVVNPDIV